MVKAEEEGASEAELNSLREILNLRQQQVDAVDRSIAQQEELNRLQSDTLDAQQAVNRERQRQAELELERSATEASSDPATDGSSSGPRRPNYDPATQYVGVDGLVRNRSINASTSTGVTARSLLERSSFLDSESAKPNLTTARSLLEGAIPADSPLRPA